MKILAVIGSPRGKGAGYRVVKKIEERMKALGEVEFSYLFLKDANLRQCTGCYACLAKGEDKCPLKDDRGAIEQQLLAADGVILSSPMYVLNVSWLMKNFIDRFAYTNHRPRFHGQKVLTVVNMGGDNPKTAIKLLRNALGGSRIIHEMGVVTPPWPQTERAVAKKERAIDVAARKFYRACLDGSLPQPTLGSLILFHLRQQAYVACRQYLPADHAFYDGKAYYFAAKVNPFISKAAKAIAIFLLKRMKDMGPGSVQWPRE